MPVVGLPDDSTYLTLTRNKFIEMAYRTIGVLEQGQILDGDLLNEGIDILTMIVREVDGAGKWRWTFEDSVHIPLLSGTFIYSIDRGLPSNISELLMASYRDASGRDTPLDILKAERYEEITNKLQYGTPKSVYLTEHSDLSLRELYVWPTFETVVATSEVSGPYRCTRTHTSTVHTEPVTGRNWKMFWESGGEGSTPWATDTLYTAAPSLRLQFRRPLIDFVTAESLPDFPMPWPRMLMYKLAFDLGDPMGIPIEERKYMIEKAKGAFNDIFPSVKVKSNTHHNKVKFF